MNRLYQEKESCYGCGACISLCKRNALSMRKDEDGFIYPVLDSNQCIQCGICEKVCPAINEVPVSKPLDVYAATYQNTQSLQKSASGGIFPALAEYVLSQGGVVFGAGTEEDFTVKTVSIRSRQELPRLQGSKYVQCDTGNIFEEIRKLLKDGITVLFCGTPCQAAGVKKAAVGLDAHLILVDLVCHGVPSMQMFQDYISYIESKQNIVIKNYRFRDKKYGQDDYFSYIFERNGREYSKCRRAAKSSFFRLFLEGDLSRESCYHCKFAAPERVGDLTLCDYWGIEQEHPAFAKELKHLHLCGVSGVLLNTEKGKDMFRKISADVVCCMSDFDKLSSHNSRLLFPVKPGSDREQILCLYRKGGYRAVDDFYHSKYFFRILRGSIGRILPLSLRKQINRLVRKGKR